MKRLFYKLAFYFVVTTHHLAIFGFIATVPLVIIKEPLWISLPIISWIMYLVYGRLTCPYTVLEDYLRRKLGMPEIKLFFKHYYKDKLFKNKA